MTTTPDDAVIEAMAKAIRSYAPNDSWLNDARAAFAALPPAYRHGPEMLEALKDVVALSDRDQQAWITARALIAKVEGRK